MSTTMLRRNRGLSALTKLAEDATRAATTLDFWLNSHPSAEDDLRSFIENHLSQFDRVHEVRLDVLLAIAQTYVVWSGEELPTIHAVALAITKLRERLWSILRDHSTDRWLEMRILQSFCRRLSATALTAA